MDRFPEYIEPDPWLAAILKRDAYRLRFDAAAAERGEWPGHDGVVDLLRAPAFVYAKVAVDAPDAVRCLTNLGFRLVDTHVVFAGSIVGEAPAVRVRPAVANDRRVVIDLARKSFHTSRFHLDPLIPDTIADTIKANWVASYFDGRRGDAMWVAEVDGEVAAFVLLIEREDHRIVDLIATASHCRRRGVARGLMIASGAGRDVLLRVGTQLANIASIALYEQLGLRVCSASYVLHFMGGRGD